MVMAIQEAVSVQEKTASQGELKLLIQSYPTFKKTLCLHPVHGFNKYTCSYLQAEKFSCTNLISAADLIDPMVIDGI